jgi:pimeloyl-ACP methyl ester carboxylesterase
LAAALISKRGRDRRFSIAITMHPRSAARYTMITRSMFRTALGPMVCLFFVASIYGQNPVRPPQAVGTAPVPAPAPPPGKKPPPPPQTISLKRTRDGVQLSATFYPSKLPKDQLSDAVPVILLHSFKGSHVDYSALALALQDAGCAVLVPDLRGHGQSTRRLMPDGQERDLETGLFNRQDFEAMASAEQDGGGDVEVCKSFLMTKNNARELNIDKLCLVGAEMGATVAIDWAAKDWSWPVLVGAGKQGQFVKALVLLSPQWSFKGMPIAQAVSNRDFASQISWMIIVGEQDSKSLGEAKRMNQSLDRYLPQFAKAQGKPSVDFHPTPTSLQSTKLLTAPNVTADIVRFIDQQVGKAIHPWMEFKSPL